MKWFLNCVGNHYLCITPKCPVLVGIAKWHNVCPTLQLIVVAIHCTARACKAFAVAPSMCVDKNSMSVVLHSKFSQHLAVKERCVATVWQLLQLR